MKDCELKLANEIILYYDARKKKRPGRFTPKKDPVPIA